MNIDTTHLSTDHENHVFLLGLVKSHYRRVKHIDDKWSFTKEGTKQILADMIDDLAEHLFMRIKENATQKNASFAITFDFADDGLYDRTTSVYPFFQHLIHKFCVLKVYMEKKYGVVLEKLPIPLPSDSITSRPLMPQSVLVCKFPKEENNA